MEASEALIAKILARWDAAGVRGDVPGVMRILNAVSDKCKHIHACPLLAARLTNNSLPTLQQVCGQILTSGTETS